MCTWSGYLTLAGANFTPALPGNGCPLFLHFLCGLQSQQPLCWAAMTGKHEKLISENFTWDKHTARMCGFPDPANTQVGSEINSSSVTLKITA